MDTERELPDDGPATRAPSTEALTRLETELVELEAELAALEAGDGRDDGSTA